MTATGQMGKVAAFRCSHSAGGVAVALMTTTCVSCTHQPTARLRLPASSSRVDRSLAFATAGRQFQAAADVSRSTSRSTVSANSDENNPMVSMPEHAKAVRASGQRRLRLINESGNSNAEVASSTPSAGLADD